MAPSKKRAASSQNTILDFFGGQNSKSKPTPCKKPKTVNELVKTEAKDRTLSGSTPADAIVIGDEDEAATSPFPRIVKTSVSDGGLKPLSFGPAILLSGPPPVKAELGNSCPEIDEGYASERVVDDCLKEFDEVDGAKDGLSTFNKENLDDDEWALGDDEIVEDDGYEDDAEDLASEEYGSSTGTCEKACPLCGSSIVGLSGIVSPFI
jgi:hypothetical protein